MLHRDLAERPTVDSIRQAGFTVTELDHTELPNAPKFARPAVVGTATAPAAAPSGATRRDQSADGRIPHTPGAR